MSRRSAAIFWTVLLGIAAIGLALRIAAAQGGLWLDEAWSAAFAHDVRAPIAVFTGIHHDNNHHLNTLWLQLVGIDAPPPLQRALSIATGTATIVIAGLIARPCGPAAAVVAALLVATSPIMVTYGSEARGYAPMLLILALSVLAVDRWLADTRRPPPVTGLTVAALVGMLAQMTMIFGLAAIGAWVAVRLWSTADRRQAVRDWTRLMAVPFATVFATALLVVRWLPGSGGFRVGSYQPFRLSDLAVGQGDLLGYALGSSIGHGPEVFVAVGGFAVLAALRLRQDRGWFYAVAIAGPPLGIALCAIGNAAIARYYLVGAFALLLLIAELAGPALAVGGWRRVGAVAILGTVLAGSLWRDAGLIDNRRADPAVAVATLAHLAPGGTGVTLDRPRAAPVLEVAARQARYPLRLVDCGAFLFVDRDGSQPFPARPRRCGASYRQVAGAGVIGLSGTAWRLYRRH